MRLALDFCDEIEGVARRATPSHQPSGSVHIRGLFYWEGSPRHFEAGGFEDPPRSHQCQGWRSAEYLPAPAPWSPAPGRNPPASWADSIRHGS